jgi:hypothetical protein
MSDFIVIYARTKAEVTQLRDVVKENFPRAEINYDRKPKRVGLFGKEQIALFLDFKNSGKEAFDRNWATASKMTEYLLNRCPCCTRASGTHVTVSSDNKQTSKGERSFSMKFIIG